MDLPLLQRAFDFALAAHGNQVRKGRPVPFIAHLMAVCALVLEHGGDETAAAAALLHDTLEDTSTTITDLEMAFGTEITGIVVACSDSLQPCPPLWKDRKQRYIGCIPAMSGPALLVTAADKLHNARDVVRSQREIGDATFRVFEGKKEGTLWYYATALECLENAKNAPYGLPTLLADLRREVEEMQRLA